MPDTPVTPDARLASIVSSSDDAIISKDLQGNITSWNVAAERMFGYTTAEAVGRNIRIIIPKDRQSEEDFVLTQIAKGVGIDHYETIRQRKDGTPFEVSLTVSPIHDTAGVVIGASKIARDISERRRFEREAFRLAAIVESSDDAIVSKDLNGIVQTWNHGAVKLFGYTAEEIIGKSIMTVIPRERLSEEDDVLRHIRAGQAVDHFETVRQRKDGSLVDISLTVSPIRDRSGTVIGASKIARDITEPRRLRLMAEEASRTKDEFLAVLSHELRTPLNTVLGYARMLRREDRKMTGELRARALDALERNAEALTRLVNDVLDTSRIVTGKLRLRVDRAPIDEVIANAVETITPAADAKALTIDVVGDSGLEVMADRDRLQQVFWNLLSNAVKFTPSGGRISIASRLAADHVVLTVDDSGVGITARDLPFVFQRFWQAQTGASRDYGGLGVGLALARHLVELHGGTIAAESEGEGCGARFTVTLPVALPSPGAIRSSPDTNATTPDDATPRSESTPRSTAVPVSPESSRDTY